MSATLSAIFLIPIWLAVLDGAKVAPYWPATTFHSHEMIFGYTMAVIAGFLLTAATNWTGVKVASGRGLLALNLLWLLGRILPLIESLPAVLIAIVDLIFLPALALTLARAMVVTKNRRNYLFLVLLGLLALANLLFHLQRFGFALRPDLARDLALRVVALMILVMGSRIIPMFTRNATKVSNIHNIVWLDRLAVGAVIVCTLMEVASAPREVMVGSWMLAGVLNILRMSTWGSFHARAPLLWILHVGYFSCGLAFVLEAMALLSWVSAASAVHCFTLGAIGLLTLGMMARVSLGHSGRMLVANRRISWAFALLAGAVVVRVFLPMLSPMHLILSWKLSGTLWTFSYLIFFTFGWGVWLRPRVE